MDAQLLAVEKQLTHAFGMAPSDLNWEDKVNYVVGSWLATGQEAITVNLQLEHQMSDGNYIRMLRVPAGSLIFGRVHVLGHILTLDFGEDIVFGPEGATYRKAPWVTTTKPGFQMVRYTVTDTVSRAILHNPDNLPREELERLYVKDETLMIARAKEVYEQHSGNHSCVLFSSESVSPEQLVAQQSPAALLTKQPAH